MAALVVAASASAQVAKHHDPLPGRIARTILATWACQDNLRPSDPVGQRRSEARSPWKPHSTAFRHAELNRWKLRLAGCRTHLRVRKEALRTARYDQLATSDLYALADQEIARGAAYSIAWGGATATLRSLCYEAVKRAFAPYGNQEWAKTIVNRESGCNPRATNTTYSSWDQQAKCIAQLIPYYHRWVDYNRCQRDLRYSVEVFVRLSHGGATTGPWAL